MAVLDTLEYLKKGGRISSVVALLGNMLNLKPIVKAVDGKVKMIGKTRGKRKGLEFMNNYIGEKWIDFSMPYGVFYTGLDESGAKVYVQNNPTIWQDGEKTPVYIMGSTIGTHVGPGAIGVAYFEK
ncbi:MAG: DegV family protein [Clostridia bacterium]|nr:DegV family protein [Clostridia bacterium]